MVVRGSQGARQEMSQVRARISAKESEISPGRPRCLLEVRQITPRCGPGTAAGGLWGRGRGGERDLG